MFDFIRHTISNHHSMDSNEILDGIRIKTEGFIDALCPGLESKSRREKIGNLSNTVQFIIGRATGM